MSAVALRAAGNRNSSIDESGLPSGGRFHSKRLVRLSKYDATHDLRTFECQVCEHTESTVVEFRAAS